MSGQLRLAEGNEASNMRRELLQYYVPVETKRGTQLMREDVLDDLSDAEFEAYENAIEQAGMGMSGKKRQERKARREDRRDLKAKAKADGTWTGGAGLKSVVSGVTDLAGKLIGGKVSDTGAEMAVETAPKNYTPYYIGGAILLLGLGYIALKPKHN